MSAVRLMMWAVVAGLACVPASWAITWLTDGDVPGGSLKKLLVGTAICWGVAAVLAAYLLADARERLERKAREQREMARLLQQPLKPVQTRKVMTESGEQAYATARGQLQGRPTPGLEPTATMAGRGAAPENMVSGELVVTDHRVIFAGGPQSFAIEVDHLMATTDHAHGVCLRTGNRTCTVLIPNERERTLFKVALRKVVGARLAAAEVKAA